MTDATLGVAVVDDLFGIRPVAPTSRCSNSDVGILDGQQRNVIVVAVDSVFWYTKHVQYTLVWI
jgi:hypothetical protein